MLVTAELLYVGRAVSSVCCKSCVTHGCGEVPSQVALPKPVPRPTYRGRSGLAEAASLPFIQGRERGGSLPPRTSRCRFLRANHRVCVVMALPFSSKGTLTVEPAQESHSSAVLTDFTLGGTGFIFFSSPRFHRFTSMKLVVLLECLFPHQ